MTDPVKNPAWTEPERLAAVADYNIASEAVYSELAQMAAVACGTPISLITILTEDRQWFKAAVGTELTGTMRAISFCTHAIEEDGPFIVTDAVADARFSDNPLVTGDTNIRAYAGVPLRTSDGLPLGTLCVIDQKPRDFTPEQQSMLKDLADRVMDVLDARKQALAAA